MELMRNDYALIRNMVPYFRKHTFETNKVSYLWLGFVIISSGLCSTASNQNLSSFIIFNQVTANQCKARHNLYEILFCVGYITLLPVTVLKWPELFYIGWNSAQIWMDIYFYLVWKPVHFSYQSKHRTKPRVGRHHMRRILGWTKGGQSTRRQGRVADRHFRAGKGG